MATSKSRTTKVRAKSAAIQPSGRTLIHELDDATSRIHQADAILDVLYVLVAPGGNTAVGANSLQELDANTLPTALAAIHGLLNETAEFIDAAHVASRAEVTRA